MKFRILLPMLSVLLAVSMLADRKATAAEGDAPVDAHHRNMGKAPVNVTTSDPGYAAWYGNSDTTYNYPTLGSSNVAGRTSANFRATTNSPEFDSWYSIGRTGRANTNGGGNLTGSGNNNPTGTVGRGPGAK